MIEFGARRCSNTMPRFQAIRCWTCGSPILRGYDADRCAIMVAADPMALLGPDGELAAIMEGRATFAIKRGCLVRRDQWSIKHTPPGGDLLVVPEHRCGDPLPGVGIQLVVDQGRRVDRLIESVEPPF